MGIKRILQLLLIVGLNGSGLAYFQETTTAELLKIADDLVQQVVRLRSLQPKAPIQKETKSREEISLFLNEHLQKNYEEDELLKEGKMLERLGLIPSAADYRDLTIKLLTEQIGGYYDPDKKTLFIAEWLPTELQKPLIVHEITHALQDQHFDLNRTIQEDLKAHNNDQTMAHNAIFEGDGMAVMLDFVLEPTGRNFAQLPDLAFITQSLYSSSLDSQYAVFKNAPLYIKETLLFSYIYGAAFMQKVWMIDPSWEAVNKIYLDLPLSTEQIIHPDKYLANRDDPKPVKFEDPATRLGSNWEIAYRNVMGEYSLQLLLRVYLSQERAAEAVTGWGGDQILLLENKAGEHAVFVASVWDTPDDAENFYLAMEEWFRKKHPEARQREDQPNEYWLVDGKEYHSLRREGSQVNFFVGLPKDDGMKLNAP